MSLFSSPRERRLWLWSLAVKAAIYSTLGLAGTLAEVLREYRLLDVSVWVLFAMFLVGATILTQGLKVRPGGTEIAIMLGVVAVYLLLFLRSTASPAERTHLMEYGVLGVFIHAALAERASRGRRVPLLSGDGRRVDRGSGRGRRGHSVVAAEPRLRPGGHPVQPVGGHAVDRRGGGAGVGATAGSTPRRITGGSS